MSKSQRKGKLSSFVVSMVKWQARWVQPIVDHLSHKCHWFSPSMCTLSHLSEGLTQGSFR